MKKRSSIFGDFESMRTIDLRRVAYLITGIAAFFLTEFGRFVYRPYIYQNHVNDFGLADSIGNLGGIIVQIFVMLAFFNSSFRKGFNLIVFLVAGYILYEFLQPYLPKGVFDWLDVYATIVGGLLAAILFVVTHWRMG